MWVDDGLGECSLGQARALGCRGEPQRWLHDPSDVLADLALAWVDGGECVSDLKVVLRDQPDLFGDVASQPTAWRRLDAIDETLLGELQLARAA